MPFARHTNLHTLHEAGLVESDALETLAPVVDRYAITVTPDMAALIDPQDPADPIKRQFLPDIQELYTAPHEQTDPTADNAHSPVRGIVHRYPDRVLLKLLHVCPVYCRFCFRREQVGPEGEGTLDETAETAALEYIASHPAIWEVILTGGDPFLLSPRRLTRVMERLKAISHVKIVRFHTRVPAVEPRRVTPALVRALNASGKAVYVVLHANHPRELTETARNACAKLIDSGLVMLSQSVLLRGINDTPEVLEALMRAFIETRIKPYYLHQLDPAPGTSHWHVPEDEGRTLMQQLRFPLSGIAQPLYVREQAGGKGKVPV
jgi:lysine 2,3-aminomutase